MKKVRVLTAEEAALLVQDGDTVSTGGFVSCACPEALTKALEKRFLETGHPRDLTLFFAAGQGHRDGTGGDHFGHEGMCKRVVGGHWDRAAKLGELALANKLEAYNLPQGVITHMYRDIAAHNIGTITHVGLYTFVDPRNGGGKLNDVTKEDLVKIVNIEGEERLLYKPIPIDVCLVRASYADEYGNCTVHREIGPLDVTAQCQATKNSGGKVIVQVEKIVQGGSLDPRLVKIPGIYVDAIVVGSIEDNLQCLGMPYDGALSGEFRIPVDEIPPIPLDAKKIIARRAAMELPQDAIVNLGTGAPEKIANVAAEEGISNKMTLTVEAGSIAGVPYGGTQFGGAANSMAILDHNVQFDFYQGGGLDVAFLGLAETGRRRRLHRHHPERQEGGLLRHLHRQGPEDRVPGRQAGHHPGGRQEEVRQPGGAHHLLRQVRRAGEAAGPVHHRAGRVRTAARGRDPHRDRPRHRPPDPGAGSDGVHAEDRRGPEAHGRAHLQGRADGPGKRVTPHLQF